MILSVRVLLFPLQKYVSNIHPPLVSGLFPQVRPSLRVLRPWHPSLRRRKAGAGERLSPGLLLLRNLREEAGHRGRVLPHGGQEAAMQAGLRGRQDEG